jgi:hypothetical protein
LRWGGCAVRPSRPCRCSSSTRSRSNVQSRLVKVMGPLPLPAPRFTRPASRRVTLHSEKMPLASVCNQRVVNEHPQFARPSSIGLAPIRSSLPLPPPTLVRDETRSRSTPRRRRFAVAGSSTPSGSAVGAAPPAVSDPPRHVSRPPAARPCDARCFRTVALRRLPREPPFVGSRCPRAAFWATHGALTRACAHSRSRCQLARTVVSLPRTPLVAPATKLPPE